MGRVIPGVKPLSAKLVGQYTRYLLPMVNQLIRRYGTADKLVSYVRYSATWKVRCGKVECVEEAEDKAWRRRRIESGGGGGRKG